MHGKSMAGHTDHPLGRVPGTRKLCVLMGVRVPPTVGWRGRESPFSGAVDPVLLTL
jgi:hypothetical protein